MVWEVNWFKRKPKEVILCPRCGHSSMWHSAFFNMCKYKKTELKTWQEVDGVWRRREITIRCSCDLNNDEVLLNYRKKQERESVCETKP